MADDEAVFASVIATRPLAEWTEVFAGTESCVTPVLELDEAIVHPHNVERETYVNVNGVRQPGVAPRFSRTPGAVGRNAPAPGEHTDEVLAEFGFDAPARTALRSAGVVA